VIAVYPNFREWRSSFGQGRPRSPEDNNPKAPQGPSVSSRRFQPAGNEAERVASTPKGLTCSPALTGPVWFFRIPSVGFTP
jgi:hypothetical protein